MSLFIKAVCLAIMFNNYFRIKAHSRLLLVMLQPDAKIDLKSTLCSPAYFHTTLLRLLDCTLLTAVLAVVQVRLLDLLLKQTLVSESLYCQNLGGLLWFGVQDREALQDSGSKMAPTDSAGQEARPKPTKSRPFGVWVITVLTYFFKTVLSKKELVRERELSLVLKPSNV